MILAARWLMSSIVSSHFVAAWPSGKR